MPGQTVILGTPNERRIARRLIDQAPFNSVLTIRGPGRSKDQNDKMWAMLSDISRAKPEGRRLTPEVWKALFMHACGHAVRFEPGLDGDGAFPVGFQSSRLSVKQMMTLIDFIQEYGDRHGVQWSNEIPRHGDGNPPPASVRDVSSQAHDASTPSAHTKRAGAES